MITDCLAPVVGQKGVGTICTMDGLPLLSRDGKFYKTNVQRRKVRLDYVYRLTFKSQEDSRVIRNVDSIHRVYLDGSAMVFTTLGWTPIATIYNAIRISDDVSEGIKYGRVLGNYIKCMVCGKPYRPYRTVWETCSLACKRVLKAKGVQPSVAIDGTNVGLAFQEWWYEIDDIVRSDVVFSEIEVVSLKSIEGSDGIFVNNIYLSGKNIVKPGII